MVVPSRNYDIAPSCAAGEAACRSEHSACASELTFRPRRSPWSGITSGRTMTSRRPGLDRRRFCVAAGAAVAAGPLGLLGFSERSRAMAMTGKPEIGGDKAAIRPFRFDVSDADLA